MKPRLRRYIPALTVGTIVSAIAVGLVALIANLASEDTKPQKKIVQVQVFRPPPPPPPEVEPPPPEVEEEVDIPEPEPVTDAPDVPDMPPGEQLGLDAEGVAGGDSFGLVGRKGGRDLLAGGSRHQWYAGRIKDQLLDYLASRDDVRAASYSVVVHVWIQGDGRLERYRLANSTGDANLDQALAHALDDMDRFDEPPPGDMPQPVRLRIVSRV